MTARQRKAQDYNFLKAATRRLLSLAGGVESAAQITRVNKTALSDYQNPQEEISFMPVDVAMDLEADTGRPLITEALAKLAGYYMVPIPDLGNAKNLAQHVAAIGKETSDIFARAALALSDEKISIEEANLVLAEVNEGLHVLLQLRGMLEKTIENKI